MYQSKVRPKDYIVKIGTFKFLGVQIHTRIKNNNF